MDPLLRAIYENPHDDGPRLVYADRLIELGDPRGELITIQCGRRKGSRGAAEAKKLLGEHIGEWLGPFKDHISGRLERYAIFRRGFPAELHILPHTSLVGAPEWSTIERLDLWNGVATDVVALLAAPVFASLASLGRLDGFEIPRLIKAGARLPTVRELHLRYDVTVDEILQVFPAVERLVLERIEDAAKFADARIAELVCGTSPSMIAHRLVEGLALLRKTRLPVLVVDGRLWRLRFTRQDGDVALEAHVQTKYAPRLKEALGQVKLGSVTWK
jgi:uncharacterized protein (TIGR02996 family)